MELAKEIRLTEVTLMRCVLALLIVFMHAFTCYNHSWREPAGFVDIPLFKWLSRVSFAFTLEAFVFIAGYLFAFQRICLKKQEDFFSLIAHKLKRLILPSILFSAAYFAIFFQFKGLSDMFYNLINGCGHLWFLPMLSWCFCGGWLLVNSKINDVWIVIFLIALNLFVTHPFPLRLSQTSTFMIYFYGGYVGYKYSDKIKRAITPTLLVRGWLLFIIVFALLRPMRDVLVYTDDAPKLLKLAMLVGNNACQLVYASVGTIVFYCTAAYYTQQHKLKSFTIKLASCCFGIYLFQQFVLQLLYYKTFFPIVVGPYWLPWCGFIIATILSYFLTLVILKKKIGRTLIG